MPLFRQPYEVTTPFGSLLLLCKTVLPHIARMPLFWFMGVMHVTLYVAFNHGYLDYTTLTEAAEDDSTINVHHDAMFVEGGTVTVITSIATVFQVFYASNCYRRYQVFHGCIRKIISCLYDFAFRMHLHGPQHKAKPHDFVAIRQVIVALLLFFHEAHRRSDDYGGASKVDTDVYDMQDDDWDRLVAMGIMHPSEVKELQPLKADQRVVTLMQRSASFVQRSFMEAKVPPSYYEALFASLSLIHQQMDRVIADINMPLPFAYFHLMQLLLTVNLSLLAYIFARSSAYSAVFVYFMSMLAYMGLRDISTNVQNPFGMDSVDYPLKDWLFQSLEDLGAMMQYNHDEEAKKHTQELEAEVRCRTRFNLTRDEVDDILDRKSVV